MFNIFIICKDTNIFNSRVEILKSYFCNSDFHYVPAQYIDIINNLDKDKSIEGLLTRYNTSKQLKLRKTGCIFAHKLAWFLIDLYKTDNNIILEQDAFPQLEYEESGIFTAKQSSRTDVNTRGYKKFVDTFTAQIKELNSKNLQRNIYLGGWIIPPKVKDLGKEIYCLKTENTINSIQWEHFKIILSHSYYIPNPQNAKIMSDLSVKLWNEGKHKALDFFLCDNKMIHSYFYPPLFIQEEHKSDIKDNKTHINSINYGL